MPVLTQTPERAIVIMRAESELRDFWHLRLLDDEDRVLSCDDDDEDDNPRRAPCVQCGDWVSRADAYDWSACGDNGCCVTCSPECDRIWCGEDEDYSY